MKILILGGTKFVGRHITASALAHGHQVTLFNRGQTNPALFPEAEKLAGDRTTDLSALQRRTWDAVIDVNGYLPRIVRMSADLLKESVGFYTFISTVSVYKDLSRPYFNEDTGLETLEDPMTEDLTGETYGGLKVLCEQVVQEIYGSRAAIIRPGLVVGPEDFTDRFTYWAVRIANGGEVLVPVGPDFPVQFIDGRDLAAFTVHITTTKTTGVFNAVGPDGGMLFGDLLKTIQKVTDSHAQLVWVAGEFLKAHEVNAWANLPLWLPDESANLETVDCRRGMAAGLKFRSLEDTIRDLLAWNAARPADSGFRPALAPEKEAEVLRLWQARS